MARSRRRGARGGAGREGDECRRRLLSTDARGGASRGARAEEPWAKRQTRWPQCRARAFRITIMILDRRTASAEELARGLCNTAPTIACPTPRRLLSRIQQGHRLQTKITEQKLCPESRTAVLPRAAANRARCPTPRLRCHRRRCTHATRPHAAGGCAGSRTHARDGPAPQPAAARLGRVGYVSEEQQCNHSRTNGAAGRSGRREPRRCGSCPAMAARQAAASALRIVQVDLELRNSAAIGCARESPQRFRRRRHLTFAHACSFVDPAARVEDTGPQAVRHLPRRAAQRRRRDEL
jgi:hypothetical protein